LSHQVKDFKAKFLNGDEAVSEAQDAGAPGQAAAHRLKQE
jgi:hypothetical protein